MVSQKVLDHLYRKQIHSNDIAQNKNVIGLKLPMIIPGLCLTIKKHALCPVGLLLRRPFPERMIFESLDKIEKIFLHCNV